MACVQIGWNFLIWFIVKILRSCSVSQRCNHREDKFKSWGCQLYGTGQSVFSAMLLMSQWWLGPAGWRGLFLSVHVLIFVSGLQNYVFINRKKNVWRKIFPQEWIYILFFNFWFWFVFTALLWRHCSRWTCQLWNLFLLDSQKSLLCSWIKLLAFNEQYRVIKMSE